MIDTVKLKLHGAAKRDIPNRRNITIAPGLRRWYDGVSVFRVEAELPKLLWGHNGRLIASQEELDNSLGRVRTLLDESVEFSRWSFTRVDLCWQFNAWAKGVILAHQWVRQQGIRKLPTLFDGGNGISWRGARSRFDLKMYQKAAPTTAGGPSVLRVELTLAGSHLGLRIDRDGPLRFDELWKVFRREVVKLPAAKVPQGRRHDFAEIIASLPPEARCIALQHYQPGRTRQSVSTFQRKVSTACLARLDWDWCRELPEEHPPSVVQVDAKLVYPRRRIPKVR